jgi:hypothetical protein
VALGGISRELQLWLVAKEEADESSAAVELAEPLAEKRSGFPATTNWHKSISCHGRAADRENRRISCHRRAASGFGLALYVL